MGDAARVGGQARPRRDRPASLVAPIFPLESGQKPYFHFLGTPPEHKRHVVLVGGHYVIGQQRSQVVREVLDWLDRYLGPVDR
jgi:hypothetical protein